MFTREFLDNKFFYKSALSTARYGSDQLPEDVGVSYCEDGTTKICIPSDGAETITIDLATGMFNRKSVALTKGEDGAFRGELPYDETFTGSVMVLVHYNGTFALCPYLPVAWTSDRQFNIIEVPDVEDEYMFIKKDVPHGGVTQSYFFSTATGSMERCTIYTPAGYMNGSESYPVLYLLNGGGDNETSWENVGRVSATLDNLIAEGKAKPMIVAMYNTMLRAGGHVSNVRDLTCEHQLIDDLIPYVENTYRAKTGKENRAIAGLSMGAYFTCDIAFANSEVFGYMGTFTASMSQTPEQKAEQYDAAGIVRPYPDFLAKVSAEEFAKTFKVYFRSTTPQEDHLELFLADDELMAKAGYDKLPNYTRILYPERTSKWNSWRMGLRDFAQKIF